MRHNFTTLNEMTTYEFLHTVSIRLCKPLFHGMVFHVMKLMLLETKPFSIDLLGNLEGHHCSLSAM